MNRLKIIFIVLILFIGPVCCCFAQIFDGTNLSSSKPYYENLPYVFEGSENYFITFKTDPEVIKQLVPQPLKPISKGEMTIIFAKHKIISPTNIHYNEAYFLTTVAYKNTFDGFIPVLYLDKVETIVPAREIWGYNKVGAEFQFKSYGNKITVTVSQLDTLIMKASFILGDPFNPTEEPESGGVINLKYIPSVIKDAPPDVKQLTISNLVDSKTTQMRIGTATLEFFGSHFNPLNRIPILEITGAGYTQKSFKMVYGEVLYDYLKNDKIK